MMQLLVAEEAAFMIVGAVGATLIGICWAFIEFYKTRARERTKRDIAAYVAEGSITPLDGARLMRAASKDSVNVDKELS